MAERIDSLLGFRGVGDTYFQKLDSLVKQIDAAQANLRFGSTEVLSDDSKHRLVISVNPKLAYGIDILPVTGQSAGITTDNRPSAWHSIPELSGIMHNDYRSLEDLALALHNVGLDNPASKLAPKFGSYAAWISVMLEGANLQTAVVEAQETLALSREAVQTASGGRNRLQAVINAKKFEVDPTYPLFDRDAVKAIEDQIAKLTSAARAFDPQIESAAAQVTACEGKLLDAQGQLERYRARTRAK